MNEKLRRALEKATHLPVRIRVTEGIVGIGMVIAGDVPIAVLGTLLIVHSIMGDALAPSK